MWNILCCNLVACERRPVRWVVQNWCSCGQVIGTRHEIKPRYTHPRGWHWVKKPIVGKSRYQGFTTSIIHFKTGKINHLWVYSIIIIPGCVTGWKVAGKIKTRKKKKSKQFNESVLQKLGSVWKMKKEGRIRNEKIKKQRQKWDKIKLNHIKMKNMKWCKIKQPTQLCPLSAAPKPAVPVSCRVGAVPGLYNIKKT